MPDDRTLTLTSSVYERLRRDVLKAHLAPGEPLRIEALCAHYDVGASPLREALNRLSAEGIVLREEKRGFRVPPISLKDLQELTETRCWINELALRKSIERGDLAWEESVLLAYHRLFRTLPFLPDSHDVSPEWEQRHRDFHASLIAACGSHWIREFAAMLFDLAERYRHLSAVTGKQRKGEDEHRAIMEAVVARDADRAVELLRFHVVRTSEIVAVAETVEKVDRET